MKAIKRILEEEQETSNLNALRLNSAYDIRTQYLVDSSGDLFLTVDLVIRLNNIITGSHNVRAAGYNKHYMAANKIEVPLYGLVDNFNDRRITHTEFAQIVLDQIHPFADGNGRTCKVLFTDRLQ